jgi:hypothetical protein
MNSKPLRLLDFWPLFFLLSSLEAAVSLLSLARIPTEEERLILGFTITRWALIFPLLVAMVTSATAAYLSWRKTDFRSRWLETKSRPNLYTSLLVVSPLLATTAGIGSFLLRWWEPERLLPFFERAWPLLAFIIIFSLQSTLWLLILRFGIHKVTLEARKPALIAFILLLFVFGFVSLTKLGVTPDPAYWGEPGVPIQGWQLGLALIAGASFLPLSLLPFFNPETRRADLIISLLIWALAVGIWLSVPNEVLKNSFYSPIDPPVNMPLPYSDSGYYDYMAHSLLVGTDYIGEVPTRPLYIVFLTILHLLVGENYNLIIVGQTLVLAFFPVLFYALGKKIHSRAAGVTIALLAIFREWTNLLVSSDTRVSNTKMLLVDIPTLMLILLACLFAFRWLERKDKRSAFIAGGFFGILLLLRTQSMLILPILFVVTFFALRSEKRPSPKRMLWLVPLLLFTLGVLVSVAPWLTHNYLRIGKFAFDAPFQYQVLASQYAYTGNLDYNAIDLEGKSLSQILITFMLKDPGFVAGFISNHFLATEVGSLLALPLIAPFDGLRAPVNIYWTSFDGTLAWYNILLLIGYLLFIAIGLGSAWRRWRLMGLLPLAFNLGYAIANGVGRFSGWRYDFPADWIAYFYLGIGFAEILIWLAKTFGAQKDFIELGWERPQIHHGEHRVHREKSFNNSVLSMVNRRFSWFIFLFALIGAIPWIAEVINPPPRYPDVSQTVMQEQLGKLKSVQALGISTGEIQEFVSQPQAVTLSGRLLYPRYFRRNTGLTSSTPWPSYAPREYTRLGFKLLNQDVREVVFPIKAAFDNVQGEDVLILGCERGDYIEARMIAFPNAGQAYLSDLTLGPCPVQD